MNQDKDAGAASKVEQIAEGKRKCERRLTSANCERRRLTRCMYAQKTSASPWLGVCVNCDRILGQLMRSRAEKNVAEIWRCRGFVVAAVPSVALYVTFPNPVRHCQMNEHLGLARREIIHGRRALLFLVF
jgi:hypothetical protein